MDSFVRNEVLCTFSQQAYSGGCVVCLLRGLPLDPCITATVKAHGYLKLDAKWLVNAASTEEATEHSYSIFRTKSVVIPSSYSSASSGVFVQFDLAEEGGTLPSFKGLHGVVSYHLLIHLQHSAHNNDAHIAFPFRVSGRGSATQSYLQSVESDIVVYAEDSLPPDHLFARVDDYSFLDEMKTHNLVYSIRDERHICNIAFTSPIFQEDFVVLVFDFDRCEQRCHHVRVKFVMSEVRASGEVLHSKYVDIQKKHTMFASLVHVRLQVPVGCPCSFVAPFFEVKYAIEIDFFIQSSDEPFTWTLPVELLPITHGFKSAMTEAVACLSAPVEDRFLIDSEFF